MTPDQMCLEAIKRGFIEVDFDRGIAYAKRYAGKQMGTFNKKGYKVATLHLDGKRAQIKIHRLVWIAKNGIPENNGLVDHINRIKDDNRLDNLRIVDNKGNATNRRSYKGEGNPAARINRNTAEAIREHHMISKNYKITAAKFRVSKSLVSQIIRKELWL